MKLFKRLIAFVLSFALLLQSYPLSAFAVKNDSASQSAKSAPSASALTASDILSEETSLRTETVRQFQLVNDTALAVSFSFPVAYRDEAGAYQIIDNTLLLNSETGVYENKAGCISVQLPEKLGNDSTVSYTSGKYTVFFTPLDTNAAEADLLETEGYEVGSLESAVYPEHLTEALQYPGAYENADLTYTVDSDILKEEIVVNSPAEAYRYTFLCSFGSLTPKLTDSGNIELLDESGSAVLEIPAGSMTDAAGNYSDAVTYELTEGDNGTYLLMVTADAEWMNAAERVFPITIDPTIKTSGYYAGLPLKTLMAMRRF